MCHTHLAPVVLTLGVALACGAPQATTAGAGASTAQTTVALGEPFQLQVGEQVETATAPSLRIRFDAVGVDSRCPRGVSCIWAGDAVVSLTVEADDGPMEVELHTHPSQETSADVAARRISLEGLSPEPEDGATIDASDYRATLVVTRTP